MEDTSFRWISVVIVIIILISVSAIIVPKLFKSVEPIDYAITNETLGINEGIYQFEKENFEDSLLLFVQLETYSNFKNVKPKLSKVEPATLEKLDSIYESFNLKFTYNKEEIIRSSSIKNILMTFKVDKTKFKDQYATEFYSWDGTDWKSKYLNYLREEDNAYYYQVSVESDGSFAITGSE